MEDSIKKQMEELLDKIIPTWITIVHRDIFRDCFIAGHDLMQSRIDEISAERDRTLRALNTAREAMGFALSQYTPGLTKTILIDSLVDIYKILSEKKDE